MNAISKAWFVIFFASLWTWQAAQAQVFKVNDDLYVGQKEDDLFFVMERVDRWNVDYWRTFVARQKDFRDRLPKTSKIKSSSYDGILGFQDYISEYYPGKSNYDLWVTYATPAINFHYKMLKNRRFFKIAHYQDALATFANIEMAFCVATTKDSPFVTHMGIGRGLAHILQNQPMHKNIAIDLHSFAAKVMTATDAQKRFMITTPTTAMREILMAGLPAGSIFLANEASGPLQTADELFILSDPSNGERLAEIDTDDNAYAWFFDKRVQRQHPPESVWTSIDLETLAAAGKLREALSAQ